MSNNEEHTEQIDDIELSEEEDKLIKAEMERLNQITSRLWIQGQRSGWETLSHTSEGVKKHNLVKRANIVRSTMPSMLNAKTLSSTIISQKPRPNPIQIMNQSKKIYRTRGIVNFGNFMSL